MDPKAQAEWFRSTFEAVRSEVAKAVIGQQEVVEGVLVALAANEHVLLEGMPGLGKTLLVRSLAEALSLEFKRIQFTPDLMPADITGTNVLATEGGERRFEFRKGPIFTNLLLADEINRATPKTQSAMLEAMQERNVTIGGQKHAVPTPFLVMATQNPIEQEGTYPLPEAQLDRFFFKLLVPYPTREDLARIVTATTGEAPPALASVADRDTVERMREVVRQVPIADSVLQIGISLVTASHPGHEEAPAEIRRYCRYGSSPRGAQALATAGRVFALLDGRFNVSKEDLFRAARPALRHRLLLNFEAEADGVTADQLVDAIVAQVRQGDRDPVPA